MKKFLEALFHFSFKQVLCCIFPVSLFIIFALSKLQNSWLIPRYDFILLLSIIVQLLMILLKLETIDEFKVICIFHVIGLGLEIFKVHMGSWSYPEYSFAKILDVPIYSGFMYASVASYICQAWKRFDLRFFKWPHKYLTFLIAILIYGNFFSHHFIPDLRWVIFFILIIMFWKTKVHLELNNKLIEMPIVLSYILIGSFIWVAENISTFLGAWQYPNQQIAWNLVHVGKISSWFLLVIISVILVVDLKKLKYPESDTV